MDKHDPPQRSYTVRPKPVSSSRSTPEYQAVNLHQEDSEKRAYNISPSSLDQLPWPVDKLHRDDWRYLIVSFLFSLFPVVFLVLIVVTSTLHDKAESEWGAKVMRAILLVSVSGVSL